MNHLKNIFLIPIMAILFLGACLLPSRRADSTPAPTPPGSITVDEFDFEAGLMPEYHSVVQELSNASLYSIEFSIADDLFHIIGRETVHYTNTEDVDLNEIQLRLFPNILGGKMTIENIKVNGQDVSPKYSLNDSLLILPIEKSLKPKAKVTLSMDFNVTISESVDLNYGVQAYYDDVLALAHAYPMIAVYDDEGWNAEIPPQSGDVVYADMSFFVITVEAPRDLTLVGSGREVSHQDNGNRQTVRYEAGPARDFYLAASMEYKVFTRESNGVTLRFHTRDHSQAGAEYALDVASRAIEIFDERYALYPYTELDFVSTPTYALGIEYPGLIVITERILEPENLYLEATVAHEVGHQWFYNLVGNDQLDDPWLDESLTQFATLQYYNDVYGQQGNQGFRADLESRWSSVEFRNIPVGLPVRDYADSEYSAIIYGRGALFFEALQKEMGEKVFDEFIKKYVRTNSWDISTPEKLKSEAESACACDLTPLFEKWIYP